MDKYLKDILRDAFPTIDDILDIVTFFLLWTEVKSEPAVMQRSICIMYGNEFV